MRTPKYTCQKCRNSIGCQDLEEIFMEEVKGYLVKPENVQAGLTDGLYTEITGGDAHEGDAVAIDTLDSSAEHAPATAGGGHRRMF